MEPTPLMKINELITQRAAAFDTFKALADKETLTAEGQTEYDAQKTAVEDFDKQIQRARDAQALSLATARPVAGQEQRLPAAPELDPYISDEAARALARTRGVMEGSARSLVV